MKSILFAGALLIAPAVLFADDASHRKAAQELVEISGSKEAMGVGFKGALEPMLAQMKQRGMPDAAVAEIRQAMDEWYAAEIKWEEFQPKITELYVQEFTEGELRDMIAFYQTPTGKKMLQKLPSVMQKSMQIGQEYFQSKGEQLNARIMQIVQKYKPAPKSKAQTE